MQLVELFLQGVRGFPTQTKLAFGPGLVVLRPAGVELRRVLQTLLFLDDRSAEVPDLEDPGAPASRMALTYRTRDGAGWRLVRDLRGGTALQRLDDASGRYSTIASQAGEIGPYLRSQAGLPSRSGFSEIFTVGAGDFPSRRAAAEAPLPVAAALSFSPGPARALPPSRHSAVGSEVAPRSVAAALSLSPGPARALPPSRYSDVGAEMAPPSPERIRALEKELTAARGIEALEAKLDEVRSRLHELDERFKVVPAAEARLEAAREAAASFAAAVPDDMSQGVSDHRAAGERRDSALARLAEEQERLAERASRPMATPPARDLRLWATAGLGTALVVTAAFTPWKPLALLGIPAFGVAAALGLVFVGDLQQRDSLGRRRAHLAGRERKVHEQWQSETLEVRRAMTTIGVERIADLESWLADRAEARRRLAAAEDALRGAVEDPRFAEAKAQLESLQAEVTRLEDALVANGAGSWRSSAEIARELERLANPALHDEVAPSGAFEGSDPAASGPAGAFGGPDAQALAGQPGALDRISQVPRPPEATGAFSLQRGGAPSLFPQGIAPVPAAGAIDDPSARLLDRAAELGAETRVALFGALAPRASAWLGALTRKRLVSFAWTDKGGVRCAGGNEGERPFLELRPGDRDLAWLALRLAIVERHQSRAPLPLILDEPFAGLPADLHPLLAKMIRGLGARGQVIHCTALDPMAADAGSA